MTRKLDLLRQAYTHTLLLTGRQWRRMANAVATACSRITWWAASRPIPSSAVESMGMGGLMGAAALAQQQLTNTNTKS